MPTLTPFLAAPVAIQFHVAAALLAVVLAPVILMRRKGGAAHRFAGRIWVVAMASVALSSFVIHEVRWIGAWSPIHILSLVTLGSLVQSVRAARRGDILLHQKIMKRLSFFALLGAGVFTLLPGRLMHEVIFSRANWFGFWVLMAGLIGAVIVWRASLRGNIQRNEI